MNNFMNNNFRVLFEFMNPAVDKQSGKIFLEIVENVFRHVTFDEMFPLE